MVGGRGAEKEQVSVTGGQGEQRGREEIAIGRKQDESERDESFQCDG